MKWRLLSLRIRPKFVQRWTEVERKRKKERKTSFWIWGVASNWKKVTQKKKKGRWSDASDQKQFSTFQKEKKAEGEQIMLCLFHCMSVSVCVREREGEMELVHTCVWVCVRENEGETWKTEMEFVHMCVNVSLFVCVCVCVCVGVWMGMREIHGKWREMELVH